MDANTQSPLRVGLVGAGAWGSRYAEKIRSLEGMRLAAVADLDEGRAAAAAGNEAKAVTSSELLAAEVDAAVIAVPAHAHARAALPLLEAGVALLVEKPLADSLEEADQLVEVAANRGVLLQAAHLERFNPAVKAVRDRITRPRFIEANRLGPFPGRGTDIDVVLDLMIHDLDLVLEFVDVPVTRVSARGIPVVSDRVDIANARLEFEDGCIADLTASRVSLKRERKLRIFQDNAYLSLDLARRTLQVVRRHPATSEDGWPTVEAEGVVVPEGDALADQLRAFAASVRSGSPPLVSGEVGRRVLEQAHAIGEEIRRWR